MKWKKCHRNRTEQSPPRISDALAGGTDARKDAAKCYATFVSPTPCKGVPIAAHSISRGGALRHIAEDGKVLGTGIPSFTDLVNTGGRPEPRPTAIRVASTFPGFCIEHDRIFGPLDNDALIPTAEQIALMSYRAVARELYGKHVMLGVSESMRDYDRGRPLPEQVAIQMSADNFMRHSLEAIPLLIAELQAWFDVIATRAFDRVSAVVIRFADMPTIQCSGAFRPDRDFADNVVMDLYAPGCPEEGATFNLLAGDATSGLAVAWVGSFAQAQAVADSLLRLAPDRIPSMLVHFAIETFDNVWMKPAWWRALSTLKQRFLIARSATGNMPHRSDEEEVYSLRDTARTFATWRIASTLKLPAV